MRAEPGGIPRRAWRGIEGGAVGTWVLGFGLVAYLGLEGGGYDALVHDRVGIAVWWVLLVAAAVGGLPRRRPGKLALAALGLLGALAIWTALSLGWTESVDKTSAELARAVGYLGVFALAALSRGGWRSRQLVAAVGTGIVAVSTVALLSRLHPAWFPEAGQTADFLPSGRERLSYPLNYWNALAALIAIGLPLLLQAAACARSIPLRALAAAALPAMALTAFLTLSRGGIAAAIVALVVFLALTSDRLPKLLTLIAAGAGATVLIAAAAQRDALQDGLLNAVAQRQGDEVLALTVAVCLAVAAVHAGALLLLRDRGRPRWTTIPRGRSLVAAIAVAAVAVVAALALDAPGRAADGWDEFKDDGGPGRGAGRLESAAGQGRYQLWVAAVEQNATKPLNGTGPGTFEYWWARRGDDSGTVIDAHSLYLQTLGELGVVGLLLLAGFLLVVLVGGGAATLRAGPGERPALAAALAGCVAFCLAAAFDWHWQIPVLPVAMLLLAAVLVTAGGGRQDPAPQGAAPLSLPLRVGFAAAAAAAIVAIAIPLASTSLLRQSEADARKGSLAAALEAARTAQNVQPGTAAPRLQQSLLLERRGSLAAAAAAVRAATEREPTNWRTWLVLSRIEAKRGSAVGAVRAYRRARSLNPHSSLFAG